MSDQQPLRTGFSTGACAAAVASAAFNALSGKKIEKANNLLFPDGQFRQMVLNRVECVDNVATAVIIKDAGDDPDVTNQAQLVATVRPAEPSECSEEDFVLHVKGLSIILRGGNGVGKVTRKGLEVPPGKWAINPVPRQMIVENIAHVIDSNHLKQIADWFLLELSIVDGEELAQKTLNPLLGIVGGLSILGTTGLVVPYSNQSYIETIRMLVRNAALVGLDTLVLCTGAKTHHAVQQLYPDLPEEAFIRIADFIAEALEEISLHSFDCVIVACMPGKLAKYSLGHRCTHAHKNRLSVELLHDDLVACQLDENKLSSLMTSATVREIYEALDQDVKIQFVQLLKKKSLHNFQKWTGKSNYRIHIFDYDSTLLT